MGIWICRIIGNSVLLVFELGQRLYTNWWIARIHQSENVEAFSCLFCSVFRLVSCSLNIYFVLARREDVQLVVFDRGRESNGPVHGLLIAEETIELEVGAAYF